MRSKRSGDSLTVFAQAFPSSSMEPGEVDLLVCGSQESVIELARLMLDPDVHHLEVVFDMKNVADNFNDVMSDNDVEECRSTARYMKRAAERLESLADRMESGATTKGDD